MIIEAARIDEIEVKQLVTRHRQQESRCRSDADDHAERAKKLEATIIFRTLTVAEAGATYKS